MELHPKILNQLYVFLGSGIVFAVAVFVLRAGGHRKRCIAGVIVLVIVAVLVIAGLGLYKCPSNVSDSFYGSTLDLQNWLKENAKPDELVFLPPNAYIWSGISERGDWFGYTQANYPIYAQNLQAEVNARFKEYGVDWRVLKGKRSLLHAMETAFNELTDVKIQQIASKYKISYLVVNKEQQKTTNFPIVYQNDEYLVHSVFGMQRR